MSENQERIVVYAGTRNLYHDMVVAAKSLMFHHGADRIIFLTEDNDFQEDLPACISIVNVSGQNIFRTNGPNFRKRWTYMVLMRCALTKLFPQYDRILTLDHDTFVRKPIDYLWNLDLSGVYMAAVEEKAMRIRQRPYFNGGVIMHNLAKMRSDKIDDTIINTINAVSLDFCEQDALNSACRNNILELPPEYNAFSFQKPTVQEEDIIIKHYAASNAKLQERDEYKRFDAMQWNEILKGVE